MSGLASRAPHEAPVAASVRGDVFFDTEGAAVYIGCTAGHLKNLRGRGEGPIFTRLFVRKGIQYARSDIDEWKRGRRFGSTTEYPENLR